MSASGVQPGPDGHVQLSRTAAAEAPAPGSASDHAVRGHLASLGPTTAAELAARTGLPTSTVDAALARLEARGVAVRGRFDPARDEEQVCDRALLARIHRYTIARLRKEVRPVAVSDFLRFLIRWQRVHPEERTVGEGGLLSVIEQLSGFEAAAAAWEADLLPARVEGYRPDLLDRLCLSGHVAWGRLAPPPLEPGARPSRATPTALFPRADLEALLQAAAPARAEEPKLRGPAHRILELLDARGALFFAEIAAGTGLLPVQVEDGLRELVAVGRVSADGWSSLRKLLTPSALRRRSRRGRPARGVPGAAAPEGRWGLLRSLAEPELDDVEEKAAWRLLRRYGVVFRDGLAREWLPGRWRGIHRALRRFEARGQVRGGRFVEGFVGEQFALPEAVTLLRRARNAGPSGNELWISASDPLNLAGILTPGPRIPAAPDRRILLRDGLPVAVEDKGLRTELGTSRESDDELVRVRGHGP